MTPNDPQPVLRVLPRGPHGLSRDQIVASQRARLLAGAIEAVAARGYVGTAVADIIARAGVSRRTFYELYEDFIYSAARGAGLSHEESKDVVQEAMITVRDYISNFVPDKSRGRFLTTPLNRSSVIST